MKLGPLLTMKNKKEAVTEPEEDQESVGRSALVNQYEISRAYAISPGTNVK